MHLPNEILLSLLGYLDGTDLKSSRLVSQAWCACASQYVFEEIYVSSAKDNLEVFEAIAQHPLLKTCARRLIYDGTEFREPTSKRRYIERLCDQKPYIFDKASSRDISDPAINEWIDAVVLKRRSSEFARRKFKKSPLIERGYQCYKENARYQQAAITSGQFYQRLIQGLKALTSLTSVTLEGSWPVLDRKDIERRYTGSYLARHWGRLYCIPQCWRWGTLDGGHVVDPRSTRDGPDGSQHFRTMVSALAEAQVHLTSFSVAYDHHQLSRYLESPIGCLPGVPPTVFDTAGPMTRCRSVSSDLMAAVFSHLEQFILSVATWAEESKEGKSTPEQYPNIQGLPNVLQSMHQVKDLELKLSTDLNQPPSDYTLYNIEDVLPKDTVWPCLKRVSLIDLSATATGLIHCLLRQMPNLCMLEIGGINLLEGTWESFFEAIAQSKHFLFLLFEWDTYLYHDDGSDFWDWAEKDTLYDDLQDYIVFGGRHPCLSDDQPDEAATDYLKEFDSATIDLIIGNRKSNL